jgi:nicotinate-nucleotide adenylyltransferase
LLHPNPVQYDVGQTARARQRFTAALVTIVALTAAPQGSAARSRLRSRSQLRSKLADKLLSVQMDLRYAVTQTRAIAKSALPPHQKAAKIVRAVTGMVRLFRPAPVGYMVGTYDPVHDGHVEMALEFQRECSTKGRGPSTVYVIPKLEDCCPDKAPIPARHRLAMINRAIAGHEGIKTLDERTLRSFLGGRTCFSGWVNGLKDWLAIQHPGARLYHITGTDAFNWAPDLTKEDLATGRREAVVPRKGYTFDNGGPPHWVKILSPEMLGWSSTKVRAALDRGERPRHVRGAVLRYIRAHGLYASGAPKR